MGLQVLCALGFKASGCVKSIVEARKLEHHSPHALKVKYKGS